MKREPQRMLVAFELEEERDGIRAIDLKTDLIDKGRRPETTSAQDQCQQLRLSTPTQELTRELT